MSKANESARPTAATVERAMRESNLEIGNSRVKDNTRNSGKQASIASLLMVGNNNGLHLRKLAGITGWTEREIRKAIHRERRDGAPILSDNRSGYFLPGDDTERKQCIRSLRHRAAEILKIANAIENGVEKP